MPYDKRKLERVDRFLIVEFKQLKKTAAYAVGITKDLSCEGFSLESQSFDFGHGEILEFILKHPVGDMSVTVLGEVVWKKQGWYKYVAGIKFHEITEETKSEVARLISTLDDMPDEPAPDRKDTEIVTGLSEGVPAVEKDEKPELRDVVGKTDESAPDTLQAAPDDIATAEKGREKKRRVIPIAAILFFISVVTVIVIINMYNKGFKSFNPEVTESATNTEVDRKQTVSADDSQTGGQTFEEPFEQLQKEPDQGKESVLTEQEGIANIEQSSAKQDTTGDMTSDLPFESGLKSEPIPRGLPAVEIKETKKPEPGPKKEKIPKKSGPVVRHEKAAGNKVIKKTAKPEKPKHAAGAKKTVKARVRAKSKKPPETKPAEKRDHTQKPEQVVKAGKIPRAGLIAKPEEPLKTIPAEEREKPEKTVPVVKPPKFPEIALIVRHKKPQKNQDGSVKEKSKFADTVLSVKWKKIGSAKNRIPLFIDTETISYPSEHIVKFSMKASINKKEFIDLIEVDCSQIKIRIVKERLKKIPVLTPYSTEWRDIIPESMPLYKAACSKRNRR